MLYLLYAELFFFIAATSHLMCHFPLSISTSWGLGLHLCCFFTMYLARGRFSISICWMIWWTFHQGLDSLHTSFLSHSFSIFRVSTQRCWVFGVNKDPQNQSLWAVSTSWHLDSTRTGLVSGGFHLVSMNDAGIICNIQNLAHSYFLNFIQSCQPK